MKEVEVKPVVITHGKGIRNECEDEEGGDGGEGEGGSKNCEGWNGGC